MAKRLRQMGIGDLELLQSAESQIKFARECLRLAGAEKAAEYVNKSLKSVQGAIRHAERCLAKNSK